MKTLIINGSPRKNGDTVALINVMVENLAGEVTIVNTFAKDISPCIDCRHCWTQTECAIDDSMQTIYQLLNEVDNVILASPIYFSELTGSLLSFASRFQVYFVAKYIRRDPGFKLKRKNGALLITAGGDAKNLDARAFTENFQFHEYPIHWQR